MISKEKAATDSTRKADDNNLPNTRLYLYGAAIIDVNGKETPITEQMIQSACKKLIRDWEFSLSPKHRIQKAL